MNNKRKLNKWDIIALLIITYPIVALCCGLCLLFLGKVFVIALSLILSGMIVMVITASQPEGD